MPGPAQAWIPRSVGKQYAWKREGTKEAFDAGEMVDGLDIDTSTLKVCNNAAIRRKRVFQTFSPLTSFRIWEDMRSTKKVNPSAVTPGMLDSKVFAVCKRLNYPKRN